MVGWWIGHDEWCVWRTGGSASFGEVEYQKFKMGYPASTCGRSHVGTLLHVMDRHIRWLKIGGEKKNGNAIVAPLSNLLLIAIPYLTIR